MRIVSLKSSKWYDYQINSILLKSHTINNTQHGTLYGYMGLHRDVASKSSPDISTISHHIWNIRAFQKSLFLMCYHVPWYHFASRNKIMTNLTNCFSPVKYSTSHIFCWPTVDGISLGEYLCIYFFYNNQSSLPSLSPWNLVCECGRFHLQLSHKKNTDNRIKNYIWKNIGFVFDKSLL